MNMMRKAAALLLALCLLLSLTACGGDSASSVQESSATSASESSASETSEESSAAESSEESPAESSQTDAQDENVIAYSGALTDEGYFRGVTALDYVTLPSLSEISLPEDVANVSDEDLQEEMDYRLSAFTTTQQVTDRAVEDGDIVNIDYVGSVDGVEFEGGSTGGAGTTVTAGSTQYIDDFLIQIIGHMPGETFDVNVTFPEDYGVDNLNGKDAVFVTTINYISDTVAPVLDDDFVYSNWYETEGWSTVEEANDGVRAQLLENAAANYLWDEIQTRAVVSEVPQEIYDYQVDAMMAYYRETANQYGFQDLDAFVNDVLELDSTDDLLTQNAEPLQQNANASLIMQAVCEERGIQVTEEDMKAFFLKNTGSEDYSTYIGQYGRPYLVLLVREELAKKALAAEKIAQG